MNSKTILGILVSLCLVASASAIDDKKKKVKAGSSVKIEKASKEKKTIKSARKSTNVAGNTKSYRVKKTSKKSKDLKSARKSKSVSKKGNK